MKNNRRGLKKRVLVLGGRGFIGRHVVQALRAQRHDVTIGSRFDGPKGNVLKVPFHQPWPKGTLGQLLVQFDVVINAVGILRERRGEQYRCIHHEFVERVAKECAHNNIRFIHVSALGLANPVRSRFLTTKRDAEKAVVGAGGDYFIVRPSLIDGDGGYGAKWFRRVAMWPVHFFPANAVGVFAPIHVLDLAQAIAALCSKPYGLHDDRQFELAGDKRVTAFEYLELLKGARAVFRVRVPSVFARAAAHLMDALHLTPYSFGHYELLKYDNVPVRNRLFELINRAPIEVGKHKHRGGDAQHAV